ncbi:MAG: hypothetical protein K8E24_015455 [Methanobacterium paludis]|nr:hypothetical protein [Methanobacterium paludis]
MTTRIGEIVNRISTAVAQGSEVQLIPSTEDYVDVAVLIKRIYCVNPISLKISDAYGNIIGISQSSTDFVGKDLNIISDSYIWSVIQQGSTPCDIIWSGIVIYDYDNTVGVKPVQKSLLVKADGDSNSGDYVNLINGIKVNPSTTWGTCKVNTILSSDGYTLNYGSSPTSLSQINSIPSSSPLILNQDLLSSNISPFLILHNTGAAAVTIYYEGIGIVDPEQI